MRPLRQCVPLCVLQAKSLAEAASLMRSSESADGAVIVARALKPVNWLERFSMPGSLDVRDIRVELVANGNAALLPDDMTHQLPLRVRDALCALAVAHAAASQRAEPVPVVRGRVALVEGVPCRRLHVDKVNLRTLATLSGPGCVIAPRSSVDIKTLLSERSRDPNLSNEEHDALVLLNETSSTVEELACGDVAFLPGSGLHNERVASAAVHRSPRTEKRELRLVVQVDDWTSK